MSDMVIFISRGKKARFHAVGVFIPFSDDKGTERESETEEVSKIERERWGKKRRDGRHAKTLKLWTWFSKKPYTRGKANNRETPSLRRGADLHAGSQHRVRA